MRRRLYFLLPDVASAERTVDDLLLARVEDRHLHVLARRGTDLGNLREASALQKTDLIHGAEIGMMVGGVGGLLVGLFIVLTPPEGTQLQFVMVLITAAVGAVFGAWASSLIGVSVPNSRLRQFCDRRAWMRSASWCCIAIPKQWVAWWSRRCRPFPRPSRRLQSTERKLRHKRRSDGASGARLPERAPRPRLSGGAFFISPTLSGPTTSRTELPGVLVVLRLFVRRTPTGDAQDGQRLQRARGLQ